MWTLLLVAQLSCADAHFLAIRSESPEVIAFARWCESQAEAERQAEARARPSPPPAGPVLCPDSGRVECRNQYDPLPPKKP